MQVSARENGLKLRTCAMRPLNFISRKPVVLELRVSLAAKGGSLFAKAADLSSFDSYVCANPI